MKKIFIRDGNLTGIAALLSLSLGFLTLFITFKFVTTKFWAIFGFLFAFFFFLLAGYSGRAKALGLKPFTNDPLGWRKAKRTYEQKEKDEQDVNKKSDDTERLI